MMFTPTPSLSDHRCVFLFNGRLSAANLLGVLLWTGGTALVCTI